MPKNPRGSSNNSQLTTNEAINFEALSFCYPSGQPTSERAFYSPLTHSFHRPCVLTSDRQADREAMRGTSSIIRQSGTYCLRCGTYRIAATTRRPTAMATLARDGAVRYLGELHSLAHSLTPMTVCRADEQTSERASERVSNRPACLAAYLTDWSVGRSVGRSVRSSVRPPVGKLTDWLLVA